MINYRKEIMFT